MENRISSIPSIIITCQAWQPSKLDYTIIIMIIIYINAMFNKHKINKLYFGCVNTHWEE